ncbi:MAG: family 20 glycosylhydrolase [Bacteroidales bacterium]|nr:family 20 glycosylhydrolase [Bacteroidales bacterium]
MKRVITLAAAAMLLSIQAPALDIVPAPSMIREGDNTGIVSERASIWCADKGLKVQASNFLRNTLASRAYPAGMAKSEAEAALVLRTDGNLAAEQYRLSVSDGRTIIIGGSPSGVWWGLQTLEQILSQSQTGTERFAIRDVDIDDCPRFGYRGVHMDCGRHFFSVDEVKDFIDLASLHKLNTLHWHLTEDQGWRLEIKKYPKLTEIGSKRAESRVGHHYKSAEQYDGIPHEGFYTQKQVKEIVAYAAERGMTIIPEIEMPGHASAALASYPELGCAGEGYQVQRNWGVFPEIFCAGKESTFEFIENVLDEVCRLFPGEYIHIGGDESPRTAWQNCPHCQKRIADEGLASEAELQSYLVRRVEKYLQSKGRKLIGWDEVLEGGVSTSSTIMSWRGTEGGQAAAKAGNDVIMCPYQYFYLDYYQSFDPEGNGEPLTYIGTNTLERCHSFVPYEGIPEADRVHILGVQGNNWTEYTPDYAHLQQMALPRLAAIAEVGWSEKQAAYADFKGRLDHSLRKVWDNRGYNYWHFEFGDLLKPAALAQLAESTTAASEHHVGRINLFRRMGAGRNEIVFFGDSITERGQWSEWFPGANVVNRGIGGDGIPGLIDALPLILEGKPEAIFIMIGVNDLIFSRRSEENLVALYSEMLDMIEKVSPETKVYVESCLPVLESLNTEWLVGKNQRIVKYNRLLRSFAAKRGITYIDSWSALQQDGSLQRLYTGDGIHLTPAGYQKVVEVLSPYIKGGSRFKSPVKPAKPGVVAHGGYWQKDGGVFNPL